MSLVAAWSNIQNEIKEKVGSSSYATWFGSIQPKEKTPEILILETPDDFFKNWIVEHYQSIIQEALAKNVNHSVEIEFIVNQTILQNENKVFKFEPGLPVAEKSPLNLNPRFTFDNFVIGPSNRFASAASLAVADNPAKAYNPLFIYGQVGLGKTHLIQSITHKINQLHPQLKHCYVSSERFTNELIEAIRHKSTNNFRKKFRETDVLLIDDIHFIAGKESTQEEFFHTFNFLHENRKQIIITSDRPPKEIANLEERLISRFAWGLIADVQPPDFETRVAILRKKLDREPVKVPDDVLFFIAEQIKTNIRELEGALIRVVAYSMLEDTPVSLEATKIILKDMVKETMKTISVEMVQKSVAEFFKVSVYELRANKRNKNIVLPRQVAMYLTRQLTNMSLPEIGSAFGGKDHTTVMHSCKKIEQDLSVNGNLKNSIQQLITGLKH